MQSSKTIGISGLAWAICLSLLLGFLAAVLAPVEAHAQLLPAQSSDEQQQGASDGEVMQQFIDVLRDDQKRQVLIESLEAATKGETAKDAGPTAIEEVPLSFVRKIADYTQQAAETTLAQAHSFWQHLKAAPAATRSA